MNVATVLRRLDAYERLIRLDKPIGTLLLLWPTLWAIWLASRGQPRVDILLIFTVGTLLMRSAGCAINDFADRRFDGAVERTRARPLPSGEIQPYEALAVGAVLALLAFALVLFLNRFAILLSIVALAVAAGYPYAKRFLAIPQAWLGVAFAFGIPMAYAATQNRLPLECWWLFAATFFWIVAYDTEYAMVDRDDDLRIGVRSSAVLFGRFEVAAVVLCYSAMFALLATLGTELALSWPFYVGLMVAAALMAYHVILIRGRRREACFEAFLHNNWVGLAIFLGIVAAYTERALIL
jgi:4-hydroxybenzoate polyprenyltransferase